MRKRAVKMKGIMYGVPGISDFCGIFDETGKDIG